MKLMSTRVTATPAYQDSLRIASESQEVRNLLGDGIEAGSFVFGLSLNNFGSQFVEWNSTLSGKRGKGHIHGVANKVNGVWELSRLILVPDAGGDKIDLAPAPRRLPVPSVPEKRLYLNPLDLDRSEPLDWAPAFYSAKFGIQVKVLPSLQADADLIDSHRHQLDSEKCL